MMLVEKHRTCRSIFVDVVVCTLCTVRGYEATTVRCYNLSLLLCGGTALPRYAAIISYVTAYVDPSLWGYGATTVRCSFHYLIDCKYFVINS